MYLLSKGNQTMKILIYVKSKYFVMKNINMVRVLNTTFNTISVISWWSVLLVEETGVPGENH